MIFFRLKHLELKWDLSKTFPQNSCCVQNNRSIHLSIMYNVCLTQANKRHEKQKIQLNFLKNIQAPLDIVSLECLNVKIGKKHRTNTTHNMLLYSSDTLTFIAHNLWAKTCKVCCAKIFYLHTQEMVALCCKKKLIFIAKNLTHNDICGSLVGNNTLSF